MIEILRVSNILPGKEFPTKPASSSLPKCRRLWESPLEFGRVIAFADLVDCVTIDEAHRRRSATDPMAWLADHSFVTGKYCFVLTNVRRLRKSLPMTGQRRLWEVAENLFHSS
jgi:hypothetical protein